jgi:uncharacterized membrane protein YhaH (DUF805 family)
MDILGKIHFYCFDFSGKLGRDGFKVYFAIDTLLEILLIVLYANVSLDNRSILNLFYVYLILLLKLIPLQVAVTKRLRDVGINPVFIFINFIPIISLIFRLYLSFAKEKINFSLALKEIGNNEMI